MLILSILATLMMALLLVWFLQQQLWQGIVRYRRAFATLTEQGVRQFFLYLDPQMLGRLASGLALVMTVLVGAVSGSWLLTVLLIPLFLYAPYHIWRVWRHHRLRQCDQQWPDMLMGLAGALQAGSGLPAAVRYLALHTPAPLGQELSLMMREQRMGVSMGASLQALSQRVPTEATGLIVAALIIASHSGGSLGPLLEDMARMIRDRLQLQGRIHALTAQGRLQAVIMAALPLLLGIVLTWLDPQAMSPLWETSAGWLMIAFMLVLELAGVVWIRRIVAIKV